MEEHRLKQMPDGYDEKLFNDIYKQTQGLRRKLASQIDSRRFGVDYKEILSWFDVKFIHAFNKYYSNKSPDLLKGHIISSLQFFKNRILRFSYSQKAQVHNTIGIEETKGSKEIQIDIEYNDQEAYLGIALSFMKENLSYEAYEVLSIELNPPLFILDNLTSTKNSTTKIPSSLIVDYLGWGKEKDAIRKVNSLRKEIRNTIDLAKEHFGKFELV